MKKKSIGLNQKMEISKKGLRYLNDILIDADKINLEGYVFFCLNYYLSKNYFHNNTITPRQIVDTILIDIADHKKFCLKLNNESFIYEEDNTDFVALGETKRMLVKRVRAIFEKLQHNAFISYDDCKYKLEKKINLEDKHIRVLANIWQEFSIKNNANQSTDIENRIFGNPDKNIPSINLKPLPMPIVTAGPMIKELKKENQKLKNQIAELQNDNLTLKTELDELKSRLRLFEPEPKQHSKKRPIEISNNSDEDNNILQDDSTIKNFALLDENLNHQNKKTTIEKNSSSSAYTNLTKMLRTENVVITADNIGDAIDLTHEAEEDQEKTEPIANANDLETSHSEDFGFFVDFGKY